MAVEEKNPRRPFASTERYEAIRRVSDQVLMGRHNARRSYLTGLLDIAAGSGRRISAICGLRYEDLGLGAGPRGGIRWRRRTDNTGRETLRRINALVRALVRAGLHNLLSAGPGLGRSL